MGEVDRAALEGKRVVVTRATAQAFELLKALQNAGAVPILLPLIRILPPEDFSPLDRALQKLNKFDWILFTSQNAVRTLRERVEALQLSFADEQHMPLAGAVGDATASEAANAGFKVEHTASRPLGIALVQELGARLNGKSVLLPRSDRANPDVITALEKSGANVTEVIAYRTISEDMQNREVVSKIMGADAVLFFSPSAVEGFDFVCCVGRLAEFAVKGSVLASGPVTLAALHANGIADAVAASEPSVARIVEALANSIRARERRVSTEASTG